MHHLFRVSILLCLSWGAVLGFDQLPSELVKKVISFEPTVALPLRYVNKKMYTIISPHFNHPYNEQRKREYAARKWLEKYYEELEKSGIYFNNH